MEPSAPGRPGKPDFPGGPGCPGGPKVLNKKRKIVSMLWSRQAMQ